MPDLPYMKNNSMRFEMAGKGAPRPLVFNVIGKTTYEPFIKSLGGLVKDTKSSVGIKKGVLMSPSGVKTENCIIGKNASKVPGRHYAQIPYAGKFLYNVGAPV
jgi:hypothetical protein